MTYHSKFFSSAYAVLMVATLSACGGGGGSSTPAAASASVSGVAATGAAIASGTVTLKCVSGTTTAATTGTDGSFNIDVSGVTLPCAGRVDYKDSTGTPQKLHTFITAAGTANITPVTELLVANLTGGTPANAFDNFDTTKAKAITAAQVKAAADAVKSYLKNTLGVDTTKLPDDPVGTKLKAAVGGAGGDDFDKVLDDLQAKLKAKGKKLSDANDDVKGGSSGGGSGGGSTESGTLKVTGVGSSARDGSYAIVDPASTQTLTDTRLFGQTEDGKFEYDVFYAANGTIKSVAVWFFGSGGSITYFGCNNGTVPCGNLVGYEPLLKQVLFNGIVLSQVTDPFASGGMTLVSSGEKIKVDGKLPAK
jgi:hypothetical protein